MVYEKEVLFLSVLLLLSLSAYGQESKEIRGTVQDSLQHPLVGAQVRLISSEDTIVTSTGSQGRFSFPPVSTTAINLIVSHVGFQTQYRHYSLKNQSGKVDVGTVILPKTATLLPEIIVRAIHPVEMKEDTIQYNAEAFSVPDGVVLEELMKSLPGIRVERDGTISIAGKEISKVQVNGQDFFGGKVQTATRNLLAEIVENVQVVDDYSEQARRTGIKSGEPQKILNINLQKDKNRGVFGQLAVGVGTEQRFLASGSVNFFREDQQFSLTSSLNNTNTNLGDAESTRGAANDLTNGSDGITTVGSADVSYRDHWSDRLSGYGGYTYFGRQNSTRRITFQQSIFQDITLLNDQQENTDDKTDQHQFNYDLDYDNQANYSFRISPRLSWGDSELSNLNRFTVSQTAMTDSLLTTGTTVSNNNTRSSEVGVNLFSVYHFKKARRSLTMQGSMGRYLNDDEQRTKTTDFSVQNQDTVGENTIDQRVWGERPTRQLTGQLAYVEPLGERALLELSYQLDYSSIART